MTSSEILSSLTPEDYQSLRKVSGKQDEYIKCVVLEQIEDKHLFTQAKGMAIISKYGANSKQYAELMEIENEKAFKRRSS